MNQTKREWNGSVTWKLKSIVNCESVAGCFGFVNLYPTSYYTFDLFTVTTNLIPLNVQLKNKENRSIELKNTQN